MYTRGRHSLLLEEMPLEWSQERWIGRRIRTKGIPCGGKSMSKSTEVGNYLKNK